MEISTLVVSDPPHPDVNLEAAANVLGLDSFVTRLKANFGAPEILSASGRDEAVDFQAALRETGLNTRILPSASLTGLPWPDPVSSLSFDSSALRATVQDESVDIPYDVEVVGVYCRPPTDFSRPATVDLRRAVASGHGPTVAEAVQWIRILDLYFDPGGAVRRISVVPDLLAVSGDDVVEELGRRFKKLKLDSRLAGVRPRARFVAGEAHFHQQPRKGYSYGTPQLRELLGSISPELGELTQFEFASRLSYALNSLGAPSGPG